MMTSFSDPSYSANNYLQFRPTYPTAFNNLLLDYHFKRGSFSEDEDQKVTTAPKLDKLLDIGCGPGEGSIPLLPHVNKKIVANDMSPVMLANVQQNYKLTVETFAINANLQFSYLGGSADDILQLLKEQERQDHETHSTDDVGDFDMVVSAETVHWLKPARFLDNISTLLKGDQLGTLAYFGYVDPVFVGYPEADAIYDEIVYESAMYLGPYWQMPGRAKLRALYRELNDLLLKDDRFTDIVVEYYDPSGKIEDGCRCSEMGAS
ncbi:unnamed protein product [Ambrosiozyma monospora]|uniref:Unnamed protein product n=1 Tax=Ambrosiozyma monospora TaxID=43982 RepID=A0A9W6Z1Z7_AMBMO|nr:unnamed protein product [Ambrosiozyma monospora]